MRKVVYELDPEILGLELSTCHDRENVVHVRDHRNERDL